MAVVSTLLLLGCGDDETTVPPSGDPAFPADYLGSYSEVRNCRQSGDHDLNLIRILADPASLAPYRDRDQPFPEGGVVLKEEYDYGDTTCSGPIKQWTVMVRLADGGSPETLGWTWQQIDAQRNVVTENASRCINCHTGCTPAMGGYENTCAVP
jgi:hypothetical protein